MHTQFVRIPIEHHVRQNNIPRVILRNTEQIMGGTDDCAIQPTITQTEQQLHRGTSTEVEAARPQVAAIYMIFVQDCIHRAQSLPPKSANHDLTASSKSCYDEATAAQTHSYRCWTCIALVATIYII